MGIYEANECVSCDLPCRGDLCPNRRVVHVECDICGDEQDKMYKYEGNIYCIDCLVEALKIDDIVQEVDADDFE